MPEPIDIREALYSSIAQACEPLFLTDADGVILYANAAFEQLTGYTLKEAAGKKPDILKSGAHSRVFYKEMWETLKAGKSWQGKLINKRKNGAQYTEELRACPIKAPGGEVKYFLAILRDITKELNLENQLLQSQKMEALGLLSGQLAHDFNNLLTIVIGATEVVLEGTRKNTTSRALLEGVLKNSKEHSALIKQLLIFSRRPDPAVKAMDLNFMLSEIGPLIKTTLSAGIKLVYNLDKDLKPVKADAEQLKQVVINILLNARDAMPGGGTVTIKTENAELAEKTLCKMKPGPYVLLTISDTGPGMPAEVLGHIFEPFFTTKPKGKGTGLGLSTAYGILESHNGRIIAKSEVGKGSDFCISPPAA